MIRKILAIFFALCMSLCFAACGDSTPEYSDKEFEISAFWAPYEITEAGLQKYKDAGFNTLAMINHSGEWNSEEQFYLGSDRTMKALELCKKLGLKAILNYNDRVAVGCEEDENYYSATPFSQYDIYGEYKDIINGIHIVDEPKRDHIDTYSNKTFVDDFKATYPNANFIVNITPEYANPQAYGFTTYDEQLDYYAQNIMSQFEKPFISVDCYPFPNEEDWQYPRRWCWLSTYQSIAQTAKKWDATMTTIMQSSVSLEFAKELTEGDMRLQVNVAMAFGAENLQYYCYSVPKGTYYYEHCIVDRENKPSVLYYYLQDIHKEIQSLADVILSYEWDITTMVNATGISTNNDTFTMMLNEFENPEYYESAIATKELLISRFISEEYGEAYMLVNYGPKDETNKATVTFKNCEKVAVYGGKGYDGTPEIYELDEEGKFVKEFEYGDGVFVVPLA